MSSALRSSARTATRSLGGASASASASRAAAGAAGSRAMHQDGRPIPHDATPSYTTSPPPPSASSSAPLPPPPDAALADSGMTPYAAPVSAASSRARPVVSQSTTARSPTGRPLLIKEFTPKGKPLFTRPPVPLPIRQRIQSTSPPADGSPFTQHNESDVIREQRGKTHPLWRFFHVPRDARGLGAEVNAQGRPTGEVGDGAGMGSLDTLDSTDGRSEIMTSGRAWTAAELRLKSFADLHTLWYLLLRERNVLATQREERRRLGIVAESEVVTKRAFRCRKSMARIKYVLNERRLGLIAAVEGAKAELQPDAKPAPIVGRSPLGGVDPLALTGLEKGVRDVLARPAVPAAPRRRRSASARSEDIEAQTNVEVAAERPLVPSSDPSITGDGERQKSLPLTPEPEAPVAEVDAPSPAAVRDEQVAQEEVEGRDEGFGGGREAEGTVRDLERRGL